MTNFQDFELGASAQVLRLGNAIGHNNLVQSTGIDAVNGVTAKNTVCHESVDARSAFLLQKLSGASDGVRCIGQIINQDRGAVLCLVVEFTSLIGVCRLRVAWVEFFDV